MAAAVALPGRVNGPLIAYDCNYPLEKKKKEHKIDCFDPGELIFDLLEVILIARDVGCINKKEASKCGARQKRANSSHSDVAFERLPRLSSSC